MLQEQRVFARAARAVFRGNVAGAVVVITLGLGLPAAAAVAGPAAEGTGSTSVYAGDVGWNGPKPGTAA
ncbi:MULTISPECIES: hypothetical protein [Streptomyces]|uniref:hypothetical protein n=1 Tax=Streptomyces TaxID=1883 RepID=UPI000897AF59|nr:hypothetical protein [Streptomyces sp. KS_5]SEC08066.1 hypothetical protein SAMN05428938_1189 [Streptomyces sp. KS_5]